MKYIILINLIFSLFISNVTAANNFNFSNEELAEIQKKNKEAIEQALGAYKKKVPSNVDLSKIPQPKAKFNGSLDGVMPYFNANFGEGIESSLDPKAKLKLFVSLSVPSESLNKYIQEADKLGRNNISIVLMGLKEGTTMSETVAYIGKLTKGYNVSVEIDPPSFERFGISLVPALVVYYDDPMHEAKCAINGRSEQSKALEYWEGKAGDVSISYAIEKMLDNPKTKFKGFLEGLQVKAL